MRRKILGDWKREIDAAYDSDAPISPLGEEMRSLVRRRNIPRQYVLDIIDGVLRDTYDDPFETFEDVRKYCYGVASAVGLVSIYIFGFKNERTKEFAESLGYALQFTNILRDVLDDIASHGRVYIPASEMEAFGVSRADLLERPARRQLPAAFRVHVLPRKTLFQQVAPDCCKRRTNAPSRPRSSCGQSTRKYWKPSKNADSCLRGKR